MTIEATPLTKILDTAIDQHTFSGIIDIRHQDTVLYARAAGYADRSNKIANTLETRFGIASGTKFLTALAIGKLIEAKQLSFSTKLKDCLALDFPRYSPEIHTYYGHGLWINEAAGRKREVYFMGGDVGAYSASYRERLDEIDRGGGLTPRAAAASRSRLMATVRLLLLRGYIGKEIQEWIKLMI